MSLIVGVFFLKGPSVVNFLCEDPPVLMCFFRKKLNSGQTLDPKKTGFGFWVWVLGLDSNLNRHYIRQKTFLTVHKSNFMTSESFGKFKNIPESLRAF